MSITRSSNHNVTGSANQEFKKKRKTSMKAPSLKVENLMGQISSKSETYLSDITDNNSNERKFVKKSKSHKLSDLTQTDASINPAVQKKHKKKTKRRQRSTELTKSQSMLENHVFKSEDMATSNNVADKMSGHNDENLNNVSFDKSVRRVIQAKRNHKNISCSSILLKIGIQEVSDNRQYIDVSNKNISRSQSSQTSKTEDLAKSSNASINLSASGDVPFKTKNLQVLNVTVDKDSSKIDQVKHKFIKKSTRSNRLLKNETQDEIDNSQYTDVSNRKTSSQSSQEDVFYKTGESAKLASSGDVSLKTKNLQVDKASSKIDQIKRKLKKKSSSNVLFKNGLQEEIDNSQYTDVSNRNISSQSSQEDVVFKTGDSAKLSNLTKSASGDVSFKTKNLQVLNITTDNISSKIDKVKRKLKKKSNHSNVLFKNEMQEDTDNTQLRNISNRNTSSQSSQEEQVKRKLKKKTTCSNLLIKDRTQDEIVNGQCSDMTNISQESNISQERNISQEKNISQERNISQESNIFSQDANSDQLNTVTSDSCDDVFLDICKKIKNATADEAAPRMSKRKQKTAKRTRDEMENSQNSDMNNKNALKIPENGRKTRKQKSIENSTEQTAVTVKLEKITPVSTPVENCNLSKIDLVKIEKSSPMPPFNNLKMGEKIQKSGLFEISSPWADQTKKVRPVRKMLTRQANINESITTLHHSLEDIPGKVNQATSSKEKKKSGTSGDTLMVPNKIEDRRATYELEEAPVNNIEILKATSPDLDERKRQSQKKRHSPKGGSTNSKVKLETFEVEIGTQKKINKNMNENKKKPSLVNTEQKCHNKNSINTIKFIDLDSENDDPEPRKKRHTYELDEPIMPENQRKSINFKQLKRKFEGTEIGNSPKRKSKVMNDTLDIFEVVPWEEEINKTDDDKQSLHETETLIVQRAKISHVPTPPSGTSTPFSTSFSKSSTLKKSILKKSIAFKQYKSDSSLLTRAQNKTISKTPVRTKMPNYALIHKQAFEKMENLADHMERKAERAKYMLSGSKPRVADISANQSSAMKTETRKIDLDEKKSKKQLKFSALTRKDSIDSNEPKTPTSIKLRPQTPKRVKSFSSKVDQFSPKITPKKQLLKPTTRIKTEPIITTAIRIKSETITPVAKSSPKRIVRKKSEQNLSSQKSTQVNTSNVDSPKILSNPRPIGKTLTNLKPQTPIKVSSIKKKSPHQQHQGYTRFGFKLPLDTFPEKVEENKPSKKVITKKMKEDNVKAVATKSHVVKNKIDERRNHIKGVRSNRRFDLLMNMRQQM